MQSKANDWYSEQLQKPSRSRSQARFHGSVQRELSRRELSEGWARLVILMLGIAGFMVGLVWSINWLRHL